MFQGDATKVVFGFCITGCAGQATGLQAAVVMSDLRVYYPCNGGAMFWMVSEDRNGWSNTLSQEIFPYAGCSSGTPVAPSITSPVSPPVAPPGPPSTPVAPSITSPVSPPVASPESRFCPSGFTGL